MIKYKDMKDKNKNNQRGFVSTQAGFFKIILLILIALLLMKYLGITVSGVINWFVVFFKNVLR